MPTPPTAQPMMGCCCCQSSNFELQVDAFKFWHGFVPFDVDPATTTYTTKYLTLHGTVTDDSGSPVNATFIAEFDRNHGDIKHVKVTTDPIGTVYEYTVAADGTITEYVDPCWSGGGCGGTSLWKLWVENYLLAPGAQVSSAYPGNPYANLATATLGFPDCRNAFTTTTTTATDNVTEEVFFDPVSGAGPYHHICHHWLTDPYTQQDCRADVLAMLDLVNFDDRTTLYPYCSSIYPPEPFPDSLGFTAMRIYYQRSCSGPGGLAFERDAYAGDPDIFFPTGTLEVMDYVSSDGDSDGQLWTGSYEITDPIFIFARKSRRVFGSGVNCTIVQPRLLDVFVPDSPETGTPPTVPGTAICSTGAIAGPITIDFVPSTDPASDHYWNTFHRMYVNNIAGTVPGCC